MRGGADFRAVRTLLAQRVGYHAWLLERPDAGEPALAGDPAPLYEAADRAREAADAISQHRRLADEAAGDALAAAGRAAEGAEAGHEPGPSTASKERGKATV